MVNASASIYVLKFVVHLDYPYYSTLSTKVKGL